MDPRGFSRGLSLPRRSERPSRQSRSAEHSAREGIRLDKDHKIARLNYVLGLILMQKHEYTESAKCFHTYLELAPNAKDAPMVRQELAKLEAAAGAPPR